MINETTPLAGVTVTYTDGSICEGNQTYQLTIDLLCNSNLLENPKLILDEQSIITNRCLPKVLMETAHGCPIKTPGAFYNFMQEYNYLVAANMLLIGFGMLVFGGMFPGLTFFVLTMIIVGVGIISLIYMYFIPALFPAWSIWIAFYFSFGMGAGLGVGATKWPHIGILLLGATVGAVLGELIDLLII